MQERAPSMKQRSEQLVILGAGLAGLSAAYHSQAGSPSGETLLLERRARPGGHTITHRQDGHVFDLTGHWLHLRGAHSLDWIRSLDPHVDWEPIPRRAEIYLSGRHLPYPFQTNLHALSPQQRKRCLDSLPEFIPQKSSAQDFEAYVLERFGQGMAELFFRPYNEKLWGCPLSELRADCMSRFLPRPDLETIRAGARGPLTQPQGYNACFYYPKQGGIDHLPRALAAKIQADPRKSLRCGHRVTRVDFKARHVQTESCDGVQTHAFDQLISTMPLPELLAVIADLPESIETRARQLKWSSWRYLDLGLNTPGPRRAQWMYVPDPEISFFRVGCSTFACPATAPAGEASVCVELADRQGTLNHDAIVADLIKVGMLGEQEDLKFVHERRIEYAYVHFDHNYAAARKEIFDFLDHHRVQSIGRYGGWDYGSMEDSLDAGRLAVTQGAHL